MKRFVSLIMAVLMLMGCMTFALPVSAADTVTVSFDANGGEGAPGAITVASGSVITLPAQQPRRAGMVFRGWAFNKADADAGYITYSADQSHQILCNSSATLYASYAYEVNLHPGFKGWGSTQKLYKFPSRDLELFHHKSDIQANYGMLPGVSGDVGNLMVFVEWNTAQLPHGRGDGASYHEKYTANASTTLYCIWGNPVIYDADGGVFPASDGNIQESYVAAHSGPESVDSVFANFGMPVGENAPYKAGARQAVDEEGNELYARIFTNGNIVRYESAKTWLEIPIFNNYSYQWSDFECAVTSYGESGMKFTAVWEPSVVYKANGGEGSDVVEYMTFAGGKLHNYNDYTVLGNSFKGNGFKGWNTKPDGTGTAYKAGSVISGYASSEPLVLYAQWEKPVSAKGEYTVSFNAMEGYLTAEDQSCKLSYGEKTPEAPVPERAGYTFRGWFNEETGAEYIPGEYYSLAEDCSYTARYELHGHHLLQKYRKSATCCEEGYYTQVCIACDYVNNTVYEKTPHTFDSWNNIDGGKVAKFCNQCFTAEIADGTVMVPQEIIAYNNYSVGCGSDDYAYIDTLNYIGPAIDNGPGSYPFGGDYFSNVNGIRNRARAKNPDIKIVLTVFNRDISKFESWIQGGNHYAFADQLVNAVLNYGFDGLDIDYEFPTNAAKSDFVALLSVIRAKFNQLEAQTGKHYILSIATPASVWAYTKFDLPGCAQYVDYINMMNYDLYCGSAFPYTHHHTPPYDNLDPYGHILTGGSVQSDITLYKSLGVPANKIVAGCGMYSRRWNNVSSANNGLFQSGSLDESNIHYDTLMNEYVNKNGFTRYWDDNAKAPYLYNPYSRQFISYDDKDSIGHKIEIVQRERIRGLMLFDYVTCDSCGIIPWIGDHIGSTPHVCQLNKTESKAATCTEDGYTLTRCSICDSIGTYIKHPREGHYSENWTLKTAPTATKQGVYTGKCVHCGGEATRTVDALGYKVSFDPNGGSMIGSSSFILQKGESYGEKLSEVKAQKQGAEFAGWYCGDYKLKTSDSFSYSSDVIFTARWTGEEVHTHSYSSAVTKAATCTTAGVITYTCDCGDSYTESVEALGHSWGEWVETTAPTTTSAGIETRTCTVCSATETRQIPMLDVDAPIVAEVSNYTVTLNGIKDIKEIRYAIGHYTKGQEVREAEKNQTLSAALVNSLTTDGVMTYEVPWVGEYTFWVRQNDGSAYFLYCDVNDITPYLESDGLRLTVKDFGENYKDMWIAEGTWNTYSEIKNNATVKYQAAATKLSNYFADHDFTYTTANPGAHTVLIRYNDGTQDVMYIDLTVDVPTFTVNGLQVTVGNIPGVKIIRSAYGEYNSIAEIKKAPLLRCFNNKTAIKDAEEYKIQYRENGMVTVIVEYNTGYKHVEHINIEQKTSTLTKSGNKVTLSGLEDGFMMVRYAKGSYKTMNGVKNATGSKYVKAESVVDGKIVVENLTAGSYTFCVQYDDESFNFHYITVA